MPTYRYSEIPTDPVILDRYAFKTIEYKTLERSKKLCRLKRFVFNADIPKRQKFALILRVYRRLSVKRIAKKMDISEQIVSNYLWRSRSRLKKLFKEKNAA